MSPESGLTPERRPGRLEPTAVGTGRILLAVAALFVLLAATMGGVFLAYGRASARSEQVAETRFPAPRLETNVNPRATADSGHGPRPYLRPAPAARAQELAPAPPRLQAAMAAVAAGREAAYEATPGGGR